MGWKALWIGNISPLVKEEQLRKMFANFGKLMYLNVFRGTKNGTFALVHYDNSESPLQAMTAYMVIKYSLITIKFDCYFCV